MADYHRCYRLDVVGDDRVRILADVAYARWIFQDGGNKMRSNCLIFAVWRTIRHGGVLILQRSHAGPYLHAMCADKLPEGLPVEHFVPRDQSAGLKLEPLFIGDVAYHIGASHASPPKRGFSLVFLFFWCINFLGWATFLALLAFPLIASAGDSKLVYDKPHFKSCISAKYNQPSKDF